MADPSEFSTGSAEGSQAASHEHLRFVKGAGTTAGAPIQHRNARRKANAQHRLGINTPASKRRERKVRM